jgi:hypothetical protein
MHDVTFILCRVKEEIRADLANGCRCNNDANKQHVLHAQCIVAQAECVCHHEILRPSSAYHLAIAVIILHRSDTGALCLWQ